jgi:hypothetical protein
MLVAVGNEEAEPAMAEVAAVERDGVVLVRVLLWSSEGDRHAIDPRGPTTS